MELYDYGTVSFVPSPPPQLLSLVELQAMIVVVDTPFVTKAPSL